MQSERKFLNRVYRRSRSENTRQAYKQALDNFKEWLGLDADKIVERIESGDLKVVSALNEWLDDLSARELSPATQWLFVSAIKKFFEVNIENLNVNWKRLDLPRRYRVEEDRIPSKQEVKRILSFGRIKDKAFVFFKFSSGVRDITMAGLRVGDIDFDIFPDVAMVNIKPEIAKDRVRHYTFITPEAKETLRAYLAFREREGEDVGSKAPLFSYRGEFMRPAAFSQRWRRLLKRSGLAEKSGKTHTLRFHTARKFFRTSLEYAGVSKSYREFLLGHKGEYLDDAYFKPTMERVLNEYRKAIPYLTIETPEKMDAEEIRRDILLDELRRTGIPETQIEAIKSIIHEKPIDEVARDIDYIGEALDRIYKREGWDPMEAHLIPNILIDEEIEQIKRERKRRKREQRIVSEDELSNHLSHGWRVAAVLGSGRIVVERGV